MQSAEAKSHDKPCKMPLVFEVTLSNLFSALNVDPELPMAMNLEESDDVPSLPKEVPCKDISSAKIQSAAFGAGLAPEKEMRSVETHSNCEPKLDTSEIRKHESSTLPTKSHNGQPIGQAVIASNKDTVNLQIDIQDDGYIKLNIHCFDQHSHTIHDSEGPHIAPYVGDPGSHKVGNRRYKQSHPYHAHKSGHVLLKEPFQKIFESIQEYDALNGQVTPSLAQWTDAFADFRGKHALCDQYWSALNNPFKFKWSDTNIVAFPGMNDALIFQTLEYHLLHQQLASRKAQYFKGVYIVPYRPHTAWWKFVSNFQLLKVYQKGTHLYGHPSIHTGRVSKMASNEKMYVLYDPGYVQSNTSNAYYYALSKCFEQLGDQEMFDFWFEQNSSLSTTSPQCMVDVGEVQEIKHGEFQTEILPSYVSDFLHKHNLNPHRIELSYDNEGWEVSMADNECDGYISEVIHIPKPISFWESTAVWPQGIVIMPNIEYKHDLGSSLPHHCTMPQLRAYNLEHCYHEPETLPNWLHETNTSKDNQMGMLRTMGSVGKLVNVLEENDPDWDQVDYAIQEHIKVLHTSKEEEAPDKDEHNDMFHKTWLEGGLLPLGCKIRQVSLDMEDMAMESRCLVVKTKIRNTIHNTCLVDGGATHSVMNVDWYEDQGIDWKSMFNISELPQHKGTMYMANDVPAEILGIAEVPMELTDAKGNKFTQAFYLMKLGKHNYAHILGFDWQYKYHARISLPEYTIELRKLGCSVSGHPIPIRLYQLRGTAMEQTKPTCEEVGPQEFMKEVRLLSARLRRFHLHIPQDAFLRQILVRPAKEDDGVELIVTSKPVTWSSDDDLEKRASILRTRIEEAYRKEYADVLECEPKGLNQKMPHQHVIEVQEGAEPYSQKMKRLSPLEMNLLGDYIKEMVEGGRIRPSDSPWGANVLFIPKPCGGFRCCQDYRELNKRMKHDTYPLPRIDVHMDMAQGSFWSKMDLLKGFYQLPMHPNSVKYTAFNTLLGKYEFLVMPMGLQSAPGSFMRAMNQVFDGLIWDPNLRQQSGILVYLDDILIFSQTEEQHMSILKKVLDRLRQYGLQCRFDKCSFAVTEIEYLGFKLSHKGVRMDPGKVEIVKNWNEQPKSKTDIRAFLGIVNYLKRFCPGLSHHSAILSDWSSEKNTDDWTDKHKTAMKAIKDMLCSDNVLACPKIDPKTDNYYPFTVITDASELAVGAIMLQQQGPHKADTKVIGYHSCKFKAAEKNYSVHEKELLGVLTAVQHWNCYLEGSKFTVYTDHSSLIWLNKLKEPSRRQARWVDILQGHDFEVLYVKGALNPADAFTRVPWVNVVDKEDQPIREPLVVLRRMHQALQDANLYIKVAPSKLKEWRDTTLDILSKPSNLPPLYTKIMEGYGRDANYSDHEWIAKNSLVFKDGLYFKQGKVAVPDVISLKRDILIEYHDSLSGGHLGVHKTQEKISRCFWWPCITVDVTNHVKICPACQMSKYRSHQPRGHTFDFTPASQPWEVIHVDFAGPFKSIAPGGYNRICVFTDAFTKLAVFIRCKTSITSEKLAELYIEHIWKVYGRPGRLVSDNEPILCADAWVHVHKKLGTKLTHISAYNAKANGAAEVMVKQLKSMLRAYEVQGLKWWKVLSACERGYNDSVHSATGFTPFYMNFGRHPYQNMESFMEPMEEQFVNEFVHNVQSELAVAHELAREKIRTKQVKDTAARNEHRQFFADKLAVGNMVWLETSALRKSHSLAPLRTGPHMITNIVANGNAVYLEGFRHPFNVALVTPTLTWANGVETHLSKLPNMSAPQKDLACEDASRRDVAVSENTTALQTSHEDSSTKGTEVQDSTTIVQQPKKPHESRGSIHPQIIPFIADYVILPSQLPGDVVRILDRTGYTRNSATLLCLFSDGSQHQIRQKHLKEIIGDIALNILLHRYTTSV